MISRASGSASHFFPGTGHLFRHFGRWLRENHWNLCIYAARKALSLKDCPFTTVRWESSPNNKIIGKKNHTSDPNKQGFWGVLRQFSGHLEEKTHSPYPRKSLVSYPQLLVGGTPVLWCGTPKKKWIPPNRRVDRQLINILNTVNMQFIIANQPHILDTPTLFCGEIPMFDVYIPICTKYTVFKK